MKNPMFMGGGGGLSKKEEGGVFEGQLISQYTL